MIILPRLVPGLHDAAVVAVGEPMASDLVVLMDLMFQLGLVARRRGAQHGD